MTDLLRTLTSGRVLLVDGAMGTELQRAGIQPGECYELWNVTHPDRVQAIHQAYWDAGAECLTTNTFQANPAALARFGLVDQLEAINAAALRLARGVSGHPFVLASVGPMDVATDPTGFDRTLRSLADADALLLETWSDQFDAAVRRATCRDANPRQLPVLLSLTFLKPNKPGQLPCLPSRLTGRDAARRAMDLGIAAIGTNCGREIDLMEMAAILHEFRSVADLPLFARPNAGTPVASGSGWDYPRSLEQMAAGIPELIAGGAQMIGGCCGTTPAHIAAFANQLEEMVPKK
jgi:5-methyltetrahydrofolate--homocysteine methyltransferase